jgi:hypothetical protein
MGITTTKPKSQAQFLSPDCFCNIDSVHIALTVESGETSNLPLHHPLRPFLYKGFAVKRSPALSGHHITALQL